MKKYIKTEKEKELLLSECLKETLKDLSEHYIKKEDLIAKTEYIIDILGDVPLDKEMYDCFIIQFRCYGGPYDVRTKPSTYKGMYELTRKYPMLTRTAIYEIWSRYIEDLFEEHSLTMVFDAYLEKLGPTDETFEKFLDYIDKAKDEHQRKYILESLKAEYELEGTYGKDFTTHIKRLITGQHFSYEEIKKYLPDPELIKRDEQHLSDISEKTRIFFGCCHPVSYKMFDILVEKKTLDKYDDTPTYYISTGRQEQATFTKQEFLESIQKTKKLHRK